MLKIGLATSEQKHIKVVINMNIQLKEQLINGINDDNMMTKIVREVAAIKGTNEISSKQVLLLS